MTADQCGSANAASAIENVGCACAGSSPAACCAAAQSAGNSSSSSIPAHSSSVSRSKGERLNDVTKRASAVGRFVCFFAFASAAVAPGKATGSVSICPTYRAKRCFTAFKCVRRSFWLARSHSACSDLVREADGMPDAPALLRG